MMMSETVKIVRKEITGTDVKEMLDDGATITAELFESGYCDENEPVKEYKAVVSQRKDGEETKIVMNMLNVLELLELYRGK